MGKLICIGETLIDFLPVESGRLMAVDTFKRCPGGAPANVAAAAARLGVSSMMITKLGLDPFGDFLLSELQKSGISTLGVSRTGLAHTALAFVSHSAFGERDFLFYRDPSADMLLSPEDIREEWFERGDILHFCSVDLVDAPCRKAHERAITLAKRKGMMVSFDVNLRFPLWDNPDELKDTVMQFARHADIVKASREEIHFLGQVSAPNLIVTMGKDGATLNGVYVPAFSVEAVDTTGAGDAFVGALLAQLLQGKPLSPDLLPFCHAAGGIVASRRGALNAIPGTEEILSFLSGRNPGKPNKLEKGRKV